MIVGGDKRLVSETLTHDRQFEIQAMKTEASPAAAAVGINIQRTSRSHENVLINYRKTSK